MNVDVDAPKTSATMTLVISGSKPPIFAHYKGHALAGSLEFASYRHH